MTMIMSMTAEADNSPRCHAVLSRLNTIRLTKL